MLLKPPSQRYAHERPGGQISLEKDFGLEEPMQTSGQHAIMREIGRSE